MIYLDDFPELEEIRKTTNDSKRIYGRYRRTYGDIDPELVRADLILLLAVIDALDEYISGAVG